MPRRKIERTAPTSKNLIDIRTGKPAQKPPLPVLGERIRFFREKAGLEQKVLAAGIGITPNAVSNWENGRGRPDINLLPDICAALGISLYDLYALEDPSGNYSAGEQRLIAQYRSLTPGHRLALGQLADTLLKVQDAESTPVLRKLTLFDRSLAAGIGDPTEFEETGTPIYLYASREADRADCVFSVSGDSMEPRFHDRDLVLVSRIPDAPALQKGEIGAFIAGNETYIKVLGSNCLESLNPDYPALQFDDASSVYLIGRVTGILDPSQIAAEEDVRKYQLLHPEED